MMYVCFFFNDPATTEIYPYGHTLSLHDALPICRPDLLFHAAIKHVDTMCEVGKDKADVQLTLEIHAERGPANTKGIAEFNYFVAVLGPDKEILTRENFPSVLTFQGTDTEVTFTVQFVATVPLEYGQAAPAHRVYFASEVTT